MLVAQLRGKLSSEVWLESEDLLTSAVFGTLKNLEPSIAIDLLALAQPLSGGARPDLGPPLQWQFWPRWETCEPDVVVEDERNLCVIEAKLYSEFGEDMGAGSQLRREWRDGLRRAGEAGKELWLLTLTNHASVPEDAIQRQIARTTVDLSRVSWLSWLEIGRFLRGLDSEAAGAWSHDLLALLARMGLAPFDGFSEVTALSHLLPDVLPWSDRPLLVEERLAGIGFQAVVEMAGTVSAPLAPSWNLAPAIRVSTVGFGLAVAATREWKEKGGFLWRPRLT